MKDQIENIIVVAGVVAFIGLLIWLTFAAPCWVFSLTHEVPARCLENFKG